MRRRRSFWLPVFRTHLLATLLIYCPTQILAQAEPSPSTSGNSRSCSANPVLDPVVKSKHAKKSKHPPPPEPLPSCLELKGDPIEIQEFLQSVVRELQWRTGENRASEDTWAFVRYLSDEELAKYGDTKVLVEPVDFTGGKAAVLIRTTELPDGYSRVQITLHLQGDGKSTDKIWAQPGNVWNLRSKGVLEKELTDALQTRYKHAE